MQEWTEENKWRNFKDGMEEAMCLLQYGMTRQQKLVKDMTDHFGENNSMSGDIFNDIFGIKKKK